MMKPTVIAGPPLAEEPVAAVDPEELPHALMANIAAIGTKSHAAFREIREGPALNMSFLSEQGKSVERTRPYIRDLKPRRCGDNERKRARKINRFG
jgi:hypothetical protein